MSSKRSRPRWEHLARLLPVETARFWHSLSEWEERWEVFWWPDGTEDGTTFDEACNERQLAWLVAQLLDCGCPKPFLRFVLGKRDLGCAVDSEDATQLRELEAGLVPSPGACFEVVCNLDGQSADALLALAGLFAVKTARGSEFVDHGRRKRPAPRDKIESLGNAVHVVQKTACQVANKWKGRVKLTIEEAGKLRQLARVSRGATNGRLSRAFELWEVQERRPIVLDEHTVVTFKLDGPREVQASWMTGDDERHDWQFAENWICSRAAGYVVDMCRGLTRERVGKCSNCHRIWAEAPRRGSPGDYCPRCRTYDLRWGERAVNWSDRGPYVEWAHERVFLTGENGISDLEQYDRIEAGHGQFRALGDPSVRFTVVTRDPL